MPCRRLSAFRFAHPSTRLSGRSPSGRLWSLRSRWLPAGVCVVTTAGGHVRTDADAPVTRTRRFQLRVSDAEHVALVSAAARAGRRELATWARETLLRVARSEPVARTQSDLTAAPSERIEVRELREAVRQLVRVGVLLNQASRALNTPGGDDDGAWARWLEGSAERVEAHAEAVRNAAEYVRGRGADSDR